MNRFIRSISAVVSVISTVMISVPSSAALVSVKKSGAELQVLGTNIALPAGDVPGATKQVCAFLHTIEKTPAPGTYRSSDHETVNEFQGSWVTADGRTAYFRPSQTTLSATYNFRLETPYQGEQVYSLSSITCSAEIDAK